MGEPHETTGEAPTTAASPTGLTLDRAAVLALVASLLATWIAAGSIGLWAHALRHVLVWLCLAVALSALWSHRNRAPASGWVLTAALILVLVAQASVMPLINLLAVVILLSIWAGMQTALNARVMAIAAGSAMVLALFRLACLAIPTFWSLADTVANGLGGLVGRITGRPLQIGATFGGLDFLVVMGALTGAWLIFTPRPRWRRGALATAAVLGGHLVYLAVLSYTPDLIRLLPPVVPPPKTPLEQTSLWHWQDAARTLLPWGIPMVAAMIQAAIAAFLFGRTSWLPVAEAVRSSSPRREQWVNQGGQWQKVPEELLSTAASDTLDRVWQSLSRDILVAALAAALIPVAVALAWSRSDLAGKTIVAYEKGNLDWLKPQHGRYGRQSAGLYGMLPVLVESLGGRFVLSADLSAQDLAGADMLLLIHPDRPWTDDQHKRIWDYVSGGGSLLVAAHCPVDEQGSKSSFNEILAPTGMTVRSDLAVSETGRWRQSLETSLHPTTAGLDDRSDQFGIQGGASIQTHWPARPVVVGRWGWSEPTADASGLGRYDAGKKLGDLVLAAEQPLGRGRVMVLGDASVLMNESYADAYLFLGRVFGYLAQRTPDQYAWWRQTVGVLAMMILLVLLAWRPRPLRTAVAAAVLALSLTACMTVSAWVSRVLPDGRGHTPNTLAYIDASHLEVHTGANWYDQGVNGLALNLMRNGYLPLLMPELTDERLERAGLLISMAPARPFSSSERTAVRRFVEGGGVLICTVGAEDTAGSRDLLADFAFQVPRSPATLADKEPEQEPMGWRVTPYVTGSKAEMMLYDGWEVQSDASNAAVRVRGDAGRPVVVTRPVGKGIVAVIGDSKFALNMNLEQADGQPLFGQHRNPLFWRWFLTMLTGQSEWIPPDPTPGGKATDSSAAEPSTPASAPAESATPQPPKPNTVPDRGITVPGDNHGSRLAMQSPDGLRVSCVVREVRS